MSSREISEKLTFTEAKVIKVLKLLVDSGKIAITSKNQYKIKERKRSLNFIISIEHYLMRELRIVFMGTPDFAVGVLQKLVEAGKNIVGVITAPDKPAGRGRKIDAICSKEICTIKKFKNTSAI